jgi:Arc/MetJ-type ribon-helix-helix transcriptional regulator
VKKTEKDRMQINVRLDDELISLLDEKRIELQRELGTIPTRSDVVRIALEKYLRASTKKAK